MKKNTGIILILVSLLYLTGCGGEQEPAAEADKMTRIAIWEDSRWADTLLYTYLEDPDPLIRARACYALGMIAPEGAEAYIADLLVDPEDEVRMEAVFAMGLTADSIYADEIFPLLDDPDRAIRRQAVISLGLIGGDTAVKVLEALARDTIEEHRIWAAEGLWRADAKQSADILIELVRDSSVAVEEAAVYSLRRLGIEESADNLRFRLRDTIPEIRMNAALGLASMKDSASLIQVSNALAGETDWRVKANLLTAIERIGDKRVMKNLMNLLSENEHPLITEMALDILAKWDIKPAIIKVRPFLKSETDILKGAALKTMAVLNPEIAMDQIEADLAGYNWHLKTYVSEALEKIATTQAVSILENLLNDEDHRVRASAYTALAAHELANFGDYVAKAIDDNDFAVKGSALDVIAEKRLEDHYHYIFEAYDDAGDNPELRFSIVSTISNSLIEDSSLVYPDVIDILNLALSDDDRVIREAAIRAFEMIGADKSEHRGKFETDIAPSNYDRYYGRFQENPVAVINTEKGPIKVELLYDIAPKTVVNFIELAESGYYDSLIFHRVVPNFVIQGGDPHGDGWGGPGYTIRSEWNRHEYRRGTMGMAHAGKDTGGSQFFICQSPQPHLNYRYTAFGQVIDGLHRVDLILPADRINSVEIIYADE